MLSQYFLLQEATAKFAISQEPLIVQKWFTTYFKLKKLFLLDVPDMFYRDKMRIKCVKMAKTKKKNRLFRKRLISFKMIYDIKDFLVFLLSRYEIVTQSCWSRCHSAIKKKKSCWSRINQATKRLLVPLHIFRSRCPIHFDPSLTGHEIVRKKTTI